jgi:plasmid stabilization system protein ParE
MLPVDFHPSATVEAAEAYRWYAERSVDAANRFADELDRVVALVGESPDRWPAYLAGTRRAVFRRFPFLLVYRIHEGRVQVLAVAHARRKPGYWGARTDR